VATAERAAETGFAAVHRRMVLRNADPSLLVGPHHEIVFLSPGVGRYLEHQGGEPSSDVFKVVREEFRLELRTALHMVRERRMPWTSRPIAEKGDAGDGATVVITVSPVNDPEMEGFALVSFAAVPGPAQPVEAIDGDTRAQALELELTAAHERTQALIEEFETSQEEMRSSNEELQSTNEELRSTLEELETSREELQSINEELQTLNQENRHKVEELSQLSSDLQNLLQATDVATLFLDRNLRILRYTPRVAEIFSVRHTDRGRPLADLTHRLGYRTLIDDARRVLQTLVSTEAEVQSTDGEASFLLRIAPYRTIDDRIEGLVITLVDVTGLKRAEAALRASREWQAFVVRLQDATRSLSDPRALQETAARLLAAHLNVQRVVYIDLTGDRPSIAAAYPQDGEPISASFLTEIAHERFRAPDVAPFATSVIHRDGRPVGALLVQDHEPRNWVAQQPLIEDFFLRTWEAAERARVEAVLKISQERFRLIVEGARDYAIMSVDGDGHIVGWSAGATAIFGWTADELIGKPVEIIFTPEDRAAGVAAKEIAKARSVGQARDSRWQLRKDGTRVYIDGSIRALSPDRSGVVEFLRIGQDVTRRIELEQQLQEANRRLEARVADRTRELDSTGQALRESDARYRTLFESMDEGFCVVDVIFDARMRPIDCRFVEVNPAFSRLTGIPAAPGQRVRALMPDHEPFWLQALGQVAISGESVRLDRPDRASRSWLDLYAFRIGDPADRRVAALFSDILERKRAEGERDALRARLLLAEEDERRRLARELHDEAGQHLTALGLGLKSLSDIAPPGSEVDQRARELRLLTETLGRELHGVAVRLRPRVLDDFGLEPALRGFVEEWSRHSGVAVEIHTAANTQRLPGAIETAIYRIVQEALTNVVRHAAATRVSVVVERHNGQVSVVIEDDGTGFDPATILESTRGPGLGLGGIRERAALLRGTVEFESRVGTGTTIFVRIPIETGAEAADA
jgi:PAS domain S-box-containing protein